MDNNEDLKEHLDGEFIGFASYPNRTRTLQFVSEGIKATNNFDGKNCVQYDVVTIPEAQTKKLNAPKKLGLKLLDLSPVAGKIFEIQQIGEGFQTDYTVKDVTGSVKEVKPIVDNTIQCPLKCGERILKSELAEHVLECPNKA